MDTTIKAVDFYLEAVDRGGLDGELRALTAKIIAAVAEDAGSHPRVGAAVWRARMFVEAASTWWWEDTLALLTCAYQDDRCPACHRETELQALADVAEWIEKLAVPLCRQLLPAEVVAAAEERHLGRQRAELDTAAVEQQAGLRLV